MKSNLLGARSPSLFSVKKMSALEESVFFSFFFFPPVSRLTRFMQFQRFRSTGETLFTARYSTKKKRGGPGTQNHFTFQPGFFSFSMIVFPDSRPKLVPFDSFFFLLRSRDRTIFALTSWCFFLDFRRDRSFHFVLSLSFFSSSENSLVRGTILVYLPSSFFPFSFFFLYLIFLLKRSLGKRFQVLAEDLVRLNVY